MVKLMTQYGWLLSFLDHYNAITFVALKKKRMFVLIMACIPCLCTPQSYFGLIVPVDIHSSVLPYYQLSRFDTFTM